MNPTNQPPDEPGILQYRMGEFETRRGRNGRLWVAHQGYWLRYVSSEEEGGSLVRRLHFRHGKHIIHNHETTEIGG